MAIEVFLAMTAAEMRNNSDIPAKIAWMACHFSPYGLGLSNLPKKLSPGSLLIVDDFTPPFRHDPSVIAEQLSRCVESLHCSGVLLDFQRSGWEETQIITEHLISALPCPAAVSDCYADNLDCPVFLPPVPPSVMPEAYFSPWKDREIWLELGLDGEILTLTEQGCKAVPLPCPDRRAEGFSDRKLHCHYSITADEKAARFTLWRNKEDTEALAEEAEALGISRMIGLYQEQLQRTGQYP